MRAHYPARTAAAALLGLLLAAVAFASNGTIDLSIFPNMAVADGRSPITVTAVVRDQQGRLVPDGTQVVFDTTLGSFRESIVTTENGFARATLVAGSIPGVARVRASALRFNANNTVELEFVTDRALLSSAKEYIEVTASNNLVYSVQERIMEGSGENQGVTVRYRDVEIRADDVQLRIPSYEVRARNAKLTIGKNTYLFDELNMKLNARRGFGIGTFEVDTVRVETAGYLAVPIKERKTRFGPVNVTAGGIRQFEGFFDNRLLKFQDITESFSTVEARKAVAYPAKEVYFYNSNVKVSGTSIMRLPLFQVSTQTATPLVTEQFFNVSNNNINVNYPYYLSLKPGEMSLFRLRYGNRFGAGAGGSQGLFLDYELKWNRGSEMDGAFTLNGLNRTDWGASIRQYFQTDSRTTIAAQIDAPAHRSLYANVNVNRQFDGFQMNLSGVHGRSLRSDNRFTNEQYNLVVEKDPVRVSNVGQVFLGLTASSNKYSGPVDRYQQAAGLQARFSSRSFRLDNQNSIMASYRISQLYGHNVQQGLSQFATVSLSTNLSQGFGMQNTYDYVNDGFNSLALGSHRLSSEAFLTTGPWQLRGFVAKTLDLDRLNAQASLNFQLNRQWRFYYSYYYDRFQSDSFLDQTYILGYTVGFREFGLSYSLRTKRIGVEILGTRF